MYVERITGIGVWHTTEAFSNGQVPVLSSQYFQLQRANTH